MKVAAVQLRSGGDVGANIAAAEALIREAAGEGAELVATPEMTHLLVRDRSELLAAVREEREDEGLSRFRALAGELGIHLLVGSLAVRDGRALRNRSFLLGPGGDVRARYDKMHMFDADVGAGDMWRESATYRAGDAPVTARVDDVKLGLSVCYDLRFPELYRHYAQAGCHLLSVPAAFTVPTGRAHWEVLLRARAIESGAYVIAPAQGGRHPDGRETFGHSTIVGPWGEVLARLDHPDPGLIFADIDTGEVERARGRIPAWAVEPRVR